MNTYQARKTLLHTALCLALPALTLLAAVPASAQQVDFQRDVRPILSSACFECHGPDEAHREADLRLDLAALPEGIVVAGDPAASELMDRVTNSDPDLRMPPADAKASLTEQQIETLGKWVEQGAAWSGHWSFQAPQQPALPKLQALDDWSSHPIDRFVAGRLEHEHLQPSPPASPETLVRRLYLDLIGLPPTIDEADAFLQDPSQDAYQLLVERLLNSPHYGEKWARHWLDAARYADSDGFEKDKPRQVWMYRDWVVQALNRDLPYDQFVIEQIAGDLLPEPTQDQLVATGFLRNSMLNEEGGIDPEQFRMEAMFDRMDAVGKAVLGLTTGCGQCHNHKYDPLTQTDYYRMFAFLNNSHEGSLAVYPGEQLARRQQILAEIDEIRQRLQSETPDWRQRLQSWVDSVRGNQPQWTLLEIHNANDNAQRYFAQDDGSLLAQGYAPTRFDAQFTTTTDLEEIRAFRVELLPDPNLPAGGPGRAVDGRCALTEFRVEVEPAGEEGERRSVKLIGASADFANEREQLGEKFGDKEGNRKFTGPVDYAIDGKDDTAWGIDRGPGRRSEARNAVFVAEENAAAGAETQLRIHLVQKHGGWNSDDNQNMNLGRFRISVSSDPEAAADPLPRRVREIVQSGRVVAELSAREVDELFAHWQTTVAQWDEANQQIEALWQQHPEGTTQLVMNERRQRRPTHRLERGDFLQPREPVQPGVPEFLHPLAAEQPTRLDFARWLVDPRSPTAARAIVNRVWQAYFGVGLVETSEDLGSQGAAPSHPQLLDWLAVQFMDNGWSLKWLHRQIVNSATYRQSSGGDAARFARDPANRLLARGPRFRLDAELVRDTALAASGLLTRQVGGPGVYPPAPEFLFRPPASYGPKTWNFDSGPDKYRRGLYTFRFRSVPYPVLDVFDTPPGTASCTRRSRSNTPLQALTTLNEPLFVECARELAANALRHEGGDDARLSYAFRRCLTRRPTDKDREVLLQLLSAARDKFQSPEGQAQAAQLVGRDGEEAAGDTAPTDAGQDAVEKDAVEKDAVEEDAVEEDAVEEDAVEKDAVEKDGVDPGEWAAWTAVCRVILNLDEAITKE